MCVPSLNNRVAHPVAPLNAVKGGASLFDFLRNDVASIGALNGNVQQQQQQPQRRPAGVANDVEMMMVDSTPGDFRHEEVTVGETNLLRSGSGATSSSSTASPSVTSVDAVISKPQTAAAAKKVVESSAGAKSDKPRPKRRRKRNQLKPGKTAKQQDRHFVVHNYHDHAGDPEQPGVATTCEFHGCNNRGGVATPFPSKLHAALSAIEEEGRSDVASWQPHGRCFIVHKPKEFQADLLPKYFNLTKITSFQRQLNLYGFTRLSRGCDHGGYYHELFLRGRPSLCLRIVRTKTKGTKFKAASSPESEPDFYSMAPVGPPPPPTTAVSGEEKMEAPSPPETVEKSETVPSTAPRPKSRISKVFAEQALPEPVPFREARRLSFPPPPAEVLSVFKTDPAPSSPALSPITPRREVHKVQRPLSDEDKEEIGSIPPLEVSLSMMMFDGPQEEDESRRNEQPLPRPHSPVRKSVSVGGEEFPIRRRQEMDPYEPLPVEPNKITTTTGAAPMVAGSWAGLFASSDARALELAAAAATNQVSESSSSEATASSSSSSSLSSSSELDDEKELCGDILGDEGGVDPIDDFVRSMISIDDDLALGDYLDVLVDC